MNLDIDMDEGVGIGFSQLHHVRAEALDSLEQALLEGTSQRPLPRVEAGPYTSGACRRRPYRGAGH